MTKKRNGGRTIGAGKKKLSAQGGKVNGKGRVECSGNKQSPRGVSQQVALMRK